MSEENSLNYQLNDLAELNLSYMPFITEGGLFIPTEIFFPLGTKLFVHLYLPGQTEPILIEGKVVWITPKNALHHVIAGVGVQFVGKNAFTIKSKIESLLDKKIEIGGYTYAISEKYK